MYRLFGYSSSLYTGFCHRLSFPFGYRLCCFYIDIWYRHSSLAIVLVCILAFGIHSFQFDQAMLFLYRHFVQTFQFGYSSSLYTGFWYRLSSLVIGSVAFIQTFGADILVWLQFQFVYWLLVQTFQFGYRLCCFYIEIWYRLSSLAIVLICIQAFGHRLSFKFGYRLCCFYIGIWYRLSSLAIVLVCILAFGHRLSSFQFRLCCFYIDIWYRLSSLAIVLVCIQAFGIDFPVWLQAMLFLYRHLVQTFQFGYSSSLYTGFWYRLSNLDINYVYYIEIWYRLSSSDIVLVCILAFGIDFPVWLQAIFFKY